MPKYEVTDTITYSRKWIVEAESKEAATTAVHMGDVTPEDVEEYESTPYKVTRLKEDPTKLRQPTEDVPCCNCGKGGPLGEHHAVTCPDHVPF